jgi:hypothetical protein
MTQHKQKRVFTVEFTSHQIPGTRRHYRHYDPVQVTVEATGIEDAIKVASKKSLTQFIHKIPKDVANVTWASDRSYEGTGYIAVQYPRGQKLSAPYMMTKRLNVEVTLGNIPVQLCFDFGD